MISEQMQKRYKLWGIVIVVFYVLCFGFLATHNFRVWIFAPFVESLIGVFMGAGAIAVITGIILIFQSSIQAEQEKKQEVFKEKMKLYSSIIDKLNDIKRDGQVNDDERLDILSIQSKIALLSNQETFDKFINFQSDLTDDEGNINENYSHLLMDFIGSARDDLEVQDTMTIEQKKALEKTKEKSKRVAESFSKSYQKTIFNNLDTMIKNKYENKKISEKTEEILRYIYNVLQSNASQNITFKFSPTLLSVKKDGKNYLGIKSSLNFIDIEHIQDKTGIEYLKSYDLEITPRTGSSKIYHKVRFQNLSEFKKCEDAIVDYMNI
jgi:hypothetical protein